MFWKKHYDAIILIKPEAKEANKKGSFLNHKRVYCSNGVNQVSKASDEVPPWPQPQGIFTTGKMFHPQVFYITVQDIYKWYCIPGTEPSPITTMEAVAFTKLLASQIRMFEGGAIGFCLFTDYNLI
ncbi:hypothetical protein J3R82DRAFT_9873 [Butyriboletus roseoflavus]|nr:hypothetical protein J3R82DRAFT_9873 [Butyriboletus roseoflavus]